MSASQTPTNGSHQAGWFKIAAAVWLLLVSALAVVNSVGLSQLMQHSQTSVQDARLQALGARVADLDHQVEALKRQPKPLARTDLDAARQALEERLSQVEQAQATDERSDDVQALQSRVGAIETRLKKPPMSAAAPRKATEAAMPKVPEPPFSVLGLELRGSERFVSIAAPVSMALADVRLLREGDAIGAWQLQAIEAHAAVFRVKGQTMRLAVP